MKRWALILFLLLSAAQAWSQLQYHQTVAVVAFFHVSAPVDIYQYSTHGLQLVGRAGEAVSLEIPATKHVPLSFLLRRSGYKDSPLIVDSNDLLAGVNGGVAQVPVNASEIPMQATTQWAPIRDFIILNRVGVTTVTLAVLMAGALLFRFERRIRRRVRKLRQLIQPDEQAEDANVGKYVGKYLLTRLLGRGGAAAVYEAVPADDLDAKERVAIKLLYNSRVSAEFKERFSREVRICKALNHPNLVRILDWEQGEVYYLVMELIQGAPLRRHVPPDGMDLLEAFGILKEVFEAVQYAHHQGVVHCDLKPENIMITNSGAVRVMDFGIATGRDYEKLTRTCDVLGTPGYVAPEQLDGVRNDPRSDQYALGVMVFEMLTGQTLYASPDPIIRITMQLTELPRRVSDLRPDIPEELSDVVIRMLSVSPQNRYPTLEGAWDDLVAAVNLDHDNQFSQRTLRISPTWQTEEALFVNRTERVSPPSE